MIKSGGGFLARALFSPQKEISLLKFRSEMKDARVLLSFEHARVMKLLPHNGGAMAETAGKFFLQACSRSSFLPRQRYFLKMPQRFFATRNGYSSLFFERETRSPSVVSKSFAGNTRRQREKTEHEKTRTGRKSEKRAVTGDAQCFKVRNAEPFCYILLTFCREVSERR